jgi:hypothetical protein
MASARMPEEFIEIVAQKAYGTTRWPPNAGFHSGMPPCVIWKAITPSYGLDCFISLRSMSTVASISPGWRNPLLRITPFGSST